MNHSIKKHFTIKIHHAIENHHGIVRHQAIIKCCVAPLYFYALVPLHLCILALWYLCTIAALCCINYNQSLYTLIQYLSEYLLVTYIPVGKILI